MSGSKVVIIAHGLSEIMFCEYVAKVTRVDVCIFARDGGRRAIQINGIQDVLTDYPSDSFASLRRAFPRLEYVLQINRKSFSEDRSVMPRLAIFTILDTDDSPQHVRSYMSGNLTRVGPMGDRVQPVYNIRNLDEVFDRYGAHIDRNNKEQSFRKVIKSLDLQDFHDFLKSDEGTNLDLFVDGCLSRSPKPMAAPTA